jgi:putative FmdB family regulatory protein
MPIYEYECGSCRHRFEKRQGFDDEPKAVCPRCEGKARRVFHAAPVIFKGSGFYVTDHRKKTESEGAPARKESKAETPAKSKSESAAPKSS